MTELSDDILLELRKKRSQEAFRKFFTHYYSRLIIWAHSITRDPQVAEDIVQDFFLDFWQNNRFDAVHSNLTSYCYRAIRNASLRHLSRQVKTTDIGGLENISADRERTIIDWELREQIFTEIDNLPDKCREVFIQCVLYGKTYEAVAQELGISINTVRTHMTKAFKTLRLKLFSVYKA